MIDFHHGSWREGDPCELCDEDETHDDPLAHFVRELTDGNLTYVVAHGQCGIDADLRLA